VRDGKCCHLTTGGGVLGIDPGFTWRHDSMILRPRDVVLIFTDGLNEAMNFHDEAFGMARVEAAAVEAARLNQPAAGICRHVLWRMRQFTGLQTRHDDLTLVAIRVL
jgi:sigma-B regulation protein RsbU (phosphoserine phosphatase)